MSASERLKALELKATAWMGDPDPADFGGHPYSGRERAIGYGSLDDPRFPESKPAAAAIIRSLPQIVAVVEAAEEHAEPINKWGQTKLGRALTALEEALS